jgi:ribosomal protein S2
MKDFENTNIIPEVTEETFNTDDSFSSEMPVIAQNAHNEPLSVQSLIAAGAGFGHRRIHKSMEPFVYSKSATGCLINMDKSFSMIKYISDFVQKKVSEGYKIVILGDKSSAEFSSVLSNYGKTNMVSYIFKYRGGILTNFHTLHQSIVKYKELVTRRIDIEARISNAESRSLVSVVSGLKKMLLDINRTLETEYRGYEGLKYLNFVERCIFIAPSIRRSEKFIKELNLFNGRRTADKCSYLVGLADSDADISSAININYDKDDYRNYNKYVLPIFANDDKLNVLIMVLDTLFASVNAGKTMLEAANVKKSTTKKAFNPKV